MHYVKGEVRSDVKIKPKLASTDREKRRSIKSLLSLSLTCFSDFKLKKRMTLAGRPLKFC